MPRPYELTATEVANKVKSQELMAEDYITSILGRTRKIDEKICAFVTFMREEALRKAREIDQKVRKGENLGCLAGVAVAV